MQIEAFIELVSTPLQAFSSSEIIDMIDPVDMQRIKATDQHPFFKAWVLAHEGMSYPRFVGDANPTPITWPRRAIQAMKDFIKKGIKFFHGHNKDNSTDGRPYLGEIVATKEMEINGQLSNVIVGYFPPDTRGTVKRLNVCSMEAVWDLIKTGAGYVADGLKELTGVALGDGKFEKPAFAGAGELASVQAFENTNGGETKMPDITFNEVEKFVKNNNVHPSQLFSWEQVKIDRVFLPDIKEIEDTAKTAADELEKQKAENARLQEEKKTADFSLQKITAKDRLAGMLKDKPEKLKSFILRKADAWQDFSDEFMQAQVAALEEDYKLLAATVEDKIQLPDKVSGGKDKDNANKAENNPALNWDAV